MVGIVGVAFAAGAGRVAGTMMVSICQGRLIVVVEDGGSLVLGGTGCRPSDLGGARLTAASGEARGSFHDLRQPVRELLVLEHRRARQLLPRRVGRRRGRLGRQLPGGADAA